MEFGLSTACLYPQQTEKTVKYYGENGVGVCEVFLNTLSETEHGYVTMLDGMCREYGMRVASIHPFTSGFEPFMMFTDYPRRFNDFLEMHKRYFDVCARLGADIFVLHGDRSQSVCPEQRYFERYLRMYELGRSYGVRVAQENVVRCRSGSAEFIARMRAALGENVRFVLDIKQAIRAQQAIPDMVEAMGGALCHLHLSDHSPEGDCLPVGKGSLDVPALFDCLRGVGFDGAVIMELYRENFNEPRELLTSLSDLIDMVKTTK